MRASSPPSSGLVGLVARRPRGRWRYGVVLARADHLDVEEHPRVVDAAELGALAGEVPIVVGRDLEVVVAAGTTSIFIRNAGIQNEWMTSGE